MRMENFYSHIHILSVCLTGGYCPGGLNAQGVNVRGVIVWGGIVRGVNVQVVNVRGVIVRGVNVRPPFQTEWNSTLQIKYRFLKKYVARTLYNFFCIYYMPFSCFKMAIFGSEL